MRNIIFVLICFYSTLCTAQTPMMVEIRGVHDGDSYMVRPVGTVSDSNFWVRVLGCDAPEVLSPYAVGEWMGREIGDSARAQFKDKTATLLTFGLDKYGRTLGILIVDGVDVSHYLLLNGYATYLSTMKLDKAARLRYRKARDEAKKKKSGIWAVNLKNK